MQNCPLVANEPEYNHMSLLHADAKAPLDKASGSARSAELSFLCEVLEPREVSEAFEVSARLLCCAKKAETGT